MDIKRLFKKNNKMVQSAGGLMNSKTYYFILFFCIMGVGIAAITITTVNLNRQRFEDGMQQRLISEEDIKGNILADSIDVIDDNEVLSINTKDISQTESTANNSEVKVNAASVSDSKSDTDKQVESEGVSNKSQTASTKKQSVAGVTSKSARLVRPVLGNIVKEFAMDKLVFCNTLEEWTTHSGIDIACAKGTQVKAADEGVISEIKNDPRYGITIIIEHPGDLRTVYSNLAGSDMVQLNQKVEKGDGIAGVGSTALFESKMEPHLHFEVWEGYKPVDPEKYLPSRNRGTVLLCDEGDSFVCHIRYVR
jgi:murein DD-endopeptidase MepM/ murein hydrolase activator NlpD